MKILLVDDDTRFRETVETALRRRGYETRGANNGKEALTLVEQFDPDWVLTDLLMPVMEGLETIQALRRMRSRARILAMSGRWWDSADICLKTARSLGAEATLTKPFSVGQLLEIVASPNREAENTTDLQVVNTEAR